MFETCTPQETNRGSVNLDQLRFAQETRYSLVALRVQPLHYCKGSCSCQRPYHAAFFRAEQVLLQQEMAHLIQVRLQRLILRTLLRELSLSVGAVGLNLLRLFCAVGLDLLLAVVLLCREPQPSGGKNDRDGQGTKELQPVPECLVAEPRPSKRRTADGEQDEKRCYGYSYPD